MPRPRTAQPVPSPQLITGGDPAGGNDARLLPLFLQNGGLADSNLASDFPVAGRSRLPVLPIESNAAPMLSTLRNRYLDLLASVYIYNEYRGYTAIDRVLDAVRARSPDDGNFISAVEKHRADERKHYLMFRRWFETQGRMPLLVDRTCGHIDRFVEIMFRQTIDELDTANVIAHEELFEKLCRIISLTEQRGHKQVEVLLAHPLVKHDRTLMKIFRIIEKDEPSHWEPYDAWLAQHGKRPPTWWERLVDTFIHSELLFLKLPILFVRPGLKRRVDWADAADPAERLASKFDLASA